MLTRVYFTVNSDNGYKQNSINIILIKIFYSYQFLKNSYI